MPVLKAVLIATCLFLSACQSTSIREMTENEPNNAKKEQNNTSQSASKDYPATQENQLRMYVFTSSDDVNEENQPRDGYFIDFKIKPKKNIQNPQQTNTQ